MARTARKLGRRILPQEFHPRIRREDAASWFAEVIAPYRTGDIAKISGASKEAVKQWKNGTSTPRLDHILNIGRKLEVVANRVEDEMRRPIDTRLELISKAQQVVQTETGERAEFARAYLRQVTRGEV